MDRHLAFRRVVGAGRRGSSIWRRTTHRPVGWNSPTHFVDLQGGIASKRAWSIGTAPLELELRHGHHSRVVDRPGRLSSPPSDQGFALTWIRLFSPPNQPSLI